MNLKFLAFFSMIFMMVFSYAQVPTPAPLPTVDFLAQVLESIQRFGGLSMVGKIAAIIMLLIASMKVSVMNQWVWSKLGSFQAAAPLVLGLAAGILNIGNSGSVTVASVMAYVSAGAGAIILHELLDMIKAIPGLGEIYITVINIIESVLGGPSAKQ